MSVSELNFTVHAGVIVLGTQMFGAAILAALTFEIADGPCPSEAGLRAEISALLPERASGEKERFRLRHVGGVLRVELFDAAGRRLGERTLPGADSCAAQEKAAAVTMAAWMLVLHPELNQPEATPAPPGKVQRPAARLPLASPRLLPPRGLPAFALAEVGVVSGLHAPRPALELGALLVHTSGWGAEVSVLVMPATEEALASGRVTWWRPSLELLGFFRARLGPASALDIGAGPALAWLSIRGHGYDLNQASRGLEPALAAILRVEPVAPLWLGARVNVFAREQSVTIAGYAGALTLPRWDLLASIGLQLR